MAQAPSSPRAPSRLSSRRSAALAVCVLGPIAAAAWFAGSSPPTQVTEHHPNPVAASGGGFGGVVRLAGTVEAVRALSVNAPRLTGQPSGAPLVITRLVASGTGVEAGDVLVEFDRQEQIRTARDRRSAFLDLEGQIQKLRAEQAAARATDDAELTRAANDVARAQLDARANPLLPRLEAERNDLALEQASARLAQLQHTFALKRTAAEAELRILEIRRDRALSDARHAERNASLMTVTAPFAGLAVLKTIYRGQAQTTEVQEGEEIRPGMPVLDLVDPSAMQVRAQVNQADIARVSVGQAARIRLDAYPELVFEGRVEQIAPLAISSSLTPRVRTFVAIISIDLSHERLMPDLSAAVDLDTVGNTLSPPQALLSSTEGNRDIGGNRRVGP